MTLESVWLIFRAECGAEFPQKSVVSVCHLASVVYELQEQTCQCTKVPRWLFQGLLISAVFDLRVP